MVLASVSFFFNLIDMEYLINANFCIHKWNPFCLISFRMLLIFLRTRKLDDYKENNEMDSNSQKSMIMPLIGKKDHKF